MGNAFRGISISRIKISHLLYVDDVMLVSSWDPENANCIIRILRCFYLAPGLKINLSKSKLIVGGILLSQVLVVADWISCATLTLLFSHLGIPVGQAMTQTSS